ncbi:hypothetical protein HPB52_002295 [Rhipicephalus sanguineus]|uniref:Uncharacterized protein n=1 Tax=Rhipicephalus sanguineus TaxID=34632 RepID=A0A9D4PS74_RHISA|nr:hypothetical protein HPB52_002295 [Rhipicephalus sanguineus]
MSSASGDPQPYDDLCPAVLARYGEIYRPLPGTREFQVSPPPKRAVPPSPHPSHDRDLPSPAMSLSRSRPATSAAVPAPDQPPNEVPNDAATFNRSTTRCVPSPPSADGPSGMPAIRTSSPTSTARDTSEPSDSTTVTLQHALESDTDIASSTIRSPIVEDSPSSSIDHHYVSTISTQCASCQQRPALTLQSTAADVRAPNQHRPNLRDAATMTEASEDEWPGSLMAEQPADATSATKADIQHADLHASPRVPPNQGKTHRSSYSSMVARRGFTVPFRTVSHTSPAPALVHPPSTPSAGTTASRATERPHQVVVGPAWARPQRTFAQFSACCASPRAARKNQWFTIVLYR